MIRSLFARLFVMGPLVFGCALACAQDADPSVSAQQQSHPAEFVSRTVLNTGDTALVANPFPTVTVPVVGLGQVLLQDARYIWRAPSRWDQSTWKDVGLISLAMVGTAAVLDRPIQNAVQRNRNRTSDKVTRVFEPFGAEYSLAVLGGFYLAGAINDDPKATAVAQDGLAASLIASGLITPVLKLAFGRSRPRLDEGTHRFQPFNGGNNAYASFPSGHATQAFAVASVVAAHYEPLWIKATAYGVASLVGYSRMYHNAHFASDVLAGAAIGSLVGTSLVTFNDRLRGSQVSLIPVPVYKGVGLALTKSL